LAEVREMVLEALTHAKLPLKFSPAEGAFYTFLTVDGDYHPMALTERLIREHGVAVIPGSAFGIDRGCTLRVAYGALEPQTVREGIQRLCHGLGKILGSAG
jgi:aspartate/methionine/tyrosine aminotransferase